MTEHCKGCVLHSNAGHPRSSRWAKDYNDWCCKYGKTARKTVGHCIVHNGKETVSWWMREPISPTR